MKQYRENEMFCHLGEDAFVTVLPKSRNASKERLVTTYIGIHNADFESCVRELVKNLTANYNYHPEITPEICPLAATLYDDATASQSA